jgi:hypothetical protein
VPAPASCQPASCQCQLPVASRNVCVKALFPLVLVLVVPFVLVVVVVVVVVLGLDGARPMRMKELEACAPKGLKDS